MDKLKEYDIKSATKLYKVSYRDFQQEYKILFKSNQFHSLNEETKYKKKQSSTYQRNDAG